MTRRYLVQDETRFDGLSDADALALAQRERSGEVKARTVEATWDVLDAVNDRETMDEIACLGVGESTILGMCDPIERIA